MNKVRFVDGDHDFDSIQSCSFLFQFAMSSSFSFQWLNGKLISVSHLSRPHSLRPFHFRLGASNSCINPILYCYMNKKFRVSFMVSTLIPSPTLRFNDKIVITFQSLITRCSLRFQDDIAMNQVRSDSYYRVYKLTTGRSMPSRKSEAGPSVSKV